MIAAGVRIDRRPRLTEQRVEGLRVLLDHLVMWEPGGRNQRRRYRQARVYLADLIRWDQRRRSACPESEA